MVDEKDLSSESVKVIDGNSLMLVRTEAAKLAFGELKPTIKHKKGKVQESIEVEAIMEELGAIDWKIAQTWEGRPRENVYVGRPRQNPEPSERWEGQITPRGFFFTNIKVESPHNLQKVTCLLPKLPDFPEPKKSPTGYSKEEILGFLKVETANGYLHYAFKPSAETS